MGVGGPYRVGTVLQLLLRRPVDNQEVVVVGQVVRTPLSGGEAGPKIGMGLRYMPMDEARRSYAEPRPRTSAGSHRVWGAISGTSWPSTTSS